MYRCEPAHIDSGRERADSCGKPGASGTAEKIRLIKHRNFGIIEPFDERVDEPAKGKPTEKITFSNRHVFACISFARVKRKAELPEGYMVITLGFPAPLNSERVAAKTEAYPGRWTHHIVVSKPEELDDELVSWIRVSYDFADAK